MSYNLSDPEWQFRIKLQNCLRDHDSVLSEDSEEFKDGFREALLWVMKEFDDTIQDSKYIICRESAKAIVNKFMFAPEFRTEPFEVNIHFSNSLGYCLALNLRECSHERKLAILDCCQERNCSVELV